MTALPGRLSASDALVPVSISSNKTGKWESDPELDNAEQ